MRNGKTSIYTIPIVISIILCFGASAQAKDWRGIVPAKSTRTDVIRLFKQCSDLNLSCDFRFEDEEVHIEFSGTSTDNIRRCSERLQPDTVLLVEVNPRKHLLLADMLSDKTSLREFSYPLDPNYRTFIDYKNGVLIELYQGSVLQVDYIAMAKDTYLCEPYYENSELLLRDRIEVHPPSVMTLSCPTKQLQAGEKVVAIVHMMDSKKRSWIWDVSAGKIIAGQGTREITIDTAGLAGQTIKVKVRGRNVTASCEVIVLARSTAAVP